MRRQWLSPMLLAAAMLAYVGAICFASGAEADSVAFDGTSSGLFGRLDLTTGVFTQTATLDGITPTGWESSVRRSTPGSIREPGSTS
jgi:hypothetical protein